MTSQSTEQPVPVQPWTITTWNVLGRERPDLERVAAALQREAPDVIVLQEVRRGQASTLAATLGMRFTWARKHSPYGPLLPSRAEGLAVLTPHALDASGHTELSDDQPMRSWRRRIALWCLVGRSDGSTLRVYDIHLSPGELTYERRAEAVRLAGVISEHGHGVPAVIAGDLNDDLDASVIFALPGIEHMTPPPTNPADDPRQHLDHVLLPADAVDVSVSAPGGGGEWTELSDHLPLTVRFRLP